MAGPVLRQVRVYHSMYGCETGCCGHTVEVDGKEHFHFDHPVSGQDPIEYAKKLVEGTLGAGHCADLDWEHAEITISND